MASEEEAPPPAVETDDPSGSVTSPHKIDSHGPFEMQESMKLFEEDRNFDEKSAFGEFLTAQAQVKKEKMPIPGKRYLHRTEENAEITREHEQYALTYGIMVGLRFCVSTMQDFGPELGAFTSATSSATASPSTKRRTLRDVKVLEMKDGIRPHHFSQAVKMFFPVRGGDQNDEDPLKRTPAHKLLGGFKFKDYAPEAFRRLRRRFGIDDVEYMLSLCSSFNFVEFVSNSKSGQFFFYSHCGKYLIKTQSRRENRFMRKILPQYYNYFADNLNTLMTRICGAHRIKVPHIRRRMYFVIMTSVFSEGTASTNEFPIHKAFDLKGSTHGRMAKPGETVKKDIDLLKEKTILKLSPTDKKDFLFQLTKDVGFLQSIRVMDYSLLVGIQYSPPAAAADEPRVASVVAPLTSPIPNNLSKLTSPLAVNTFRSNRRVSLLALSTHPQHAPGFKPDPAMNAIDSSTTHPHLSTSRSLESMPVTSVAKPMHLSASKSLNSMASSPLRHRSLPGAATDLPATPSPNKDNGSLTATAATNGTSSSRLSRSSLNKFSSPLPKTVNGTSDMGPVAQDRFSLIKGTPARLSDVAKQPLTRTENQSRETQPGEEQEKYFVGIIDIFTPWNFSKSAEGSFKAVRHGGSSSISAVNPIVYAKRFLRFMEKNLMVNNNSEPKPDK